MIPTAEGYLSELNETQRLAVTHTDGPCLVVAGPGSGKTRVLTYRIAHLIEQGVAPWEILTLTFTNKAAREMKDRISKVVGGAANKVWAGTFHSIFAKILRIEADKIGYSSNFTIYDSEDSKSLIKSILKDLNLTTEQYSPNAVLSRISSAKSNLITPTLYKNDEELRQQDRMNKRPRMAEIYQHYSNRCKRADAMDFDDLLYRLFELLHKNPEGVRQKYQEKFRYVLVDEFQDTNHLQYEIVKKLVEYDQSPRNICVVGDDAQSIYSFRGATIRNILDFEKDFRPYQIQVFKLEQNYRSTQHIVAAANQLITYNKKQIPKTIKSERGDGHKIKLIRTMTDREECKRVIDELEFQMRTRTLKRKDFAILYRTNSQSRMFEEYLRARSIAYRVFGGQSFYQRKEIKDMMAYFRLVVNLKDEEALRRVINYPRRGVGNASLEKIQLQAEAMQSSLWEAIPFAPLSGRAKKTLDEFVSMIKGLHKNLDTLNAYELATQIAQKSGLISLLKKDTTIEGMSRFENLSSLMDGVKEFAEGIDETAEETADVSLRAYVQNISLLTDQDKEDEDPDYVTLMSIHAAKGLEFPSVFVVGLEENLFPSFMSMDSPEGIDEERRLFYVAVTRAESFLTLSFASSRYKYGSMKYNEPSRFINEIDPRHLESTISSFSTNSPRGTAPAARQTSGVRGYIKKSPTSPVQNIDTSNFKPSPPEAIQPGFKVLHLKFGEGKVLSIDGNREKRIATIFFKDIENPQRRLMLKHAKLQILDN